MYFEEESRNQTISQVLTNKTFTSVLMICLVLQPVMYMLIVKQFPWYFNDSIKTRAWILTAIASAIMTIGSLPFLWSFYANERHFVRFGWSDGMYPTALCAFFMSYLIHDLLIGTIEYRSYIHPLSGWFHHLLYTLLCFLFVKWRVSGVFCCFAILEAPTFIMSLGSINKLLRKDKLFGVIFFLTRILLHIYFTWRVFVSFPNQHYHILTASIFPLHALWFRGWVRQQIRLQGYVFGFRKAANRLGLRKPQVEVTKKTVISEEKERDYVDHSYEKNSSRLRHESMQLRKMPAKAVAVC